MATVMTEMRARPGRIASSRGISIPFTDRPLVMGVLNITPDSFSDGGRWLDPSRAVDRAAEMAGQGAELLDLGAESTRPGGGVYGPGATEVSAAEELDRLLPVLEAVRSRVEVPISVDTRKAEVARAAIEMGADFVNDVSALDDPSMAEVVANAECSIVVMHSRGPLANMQRDIAFTSVVEEVMEELHARVKRATEGGIDRDRILVDPGIGFGKTTAHNLELLGRLHELHRIGLPILVGASRKAFIGDVISAPIEERLSGSLAAVGWAALRGAAVVRVHDVLDTVRFLDLWQAIETTTTQRAVTA